MFSFLEIQFIIQSGVEVNHYDLSQDKPPFLEKNSDQLIKIFNSIVDRCNEVRYSDAEWMEIRYIGREGKGYLLGKYIETLHVSIRDDTGISIDKLNVIKVERIYSGTKTVMEFRPANKNK